MAEEIPLMLPNGRVNWAHPDLKARLCQLRANGNTASEIRLALQDEFDLALTPNMVENAIYRHCGDVKPRSRALSPEDVPPPEPQPDREARQREIFVETVTKALKKVKPQYVYQKREPQDVHSEETPFLFINDVHAGARWGPEGWVCDYDVEIMLRRFDRLKKKFWKLFDYETPRRSTKRIIISLLGDLVEGNVVFPGQGLMTELSTPEQTVEILKLLADLISTLSVEMPDVWVYGVIGNHGRMSARPSESTAWDNWDYWIYQMLAWHFQDIENVHICPSKIEWAAFHLPESERFTHVIYHGHKLGARSLGIPFYPAKREASEWAQFLPGEIKYIYLGHEHLEAKLPLSPHGGIYYMPPFCGASDLGVNKSRRYTRPGQKVLWFHEDEGVTVDYTLWLEDIIMPEADAQGIITPWGRVVDELSLPEVEAV